MPNKDETVTSLSELNLTEGLTLASFSRALIQADGRLSDAERDSLAAIGREVGHTRWAELLDDAAKKYSGETGIKKLADQVDRTDARELIYGALFDLASTGSVVKHEQEILNWLKEHWQLEPQIQNPPE